MIQIYHHQYILPKMCPLWMYCDTTMAMAQQGSLRQGTILEVITRALGVGRKVHYLMTLYMPLEVNHYRYLRDRNLFSKAIFGSKAYSLMNGMFKI